MDKCCKFLKVVVIIVNCLTIVAGVGVIVLAAHGMSVADKLKGMDDDHERLTNNHTISITSRDNHQHRSEGDDELFASRLFKFSVVVLILGAVMVIIGFLGCFGAAMENQSLLGLFVLLMVLALGLNIAGAILLKFNEGKIEQEANRGLQRIFQSTALQHNYDTADLIQTWLGCCGFKSYNEWPSSVKFPQSCCKDKVADCPTPSGHPLTAKDSQGIYNPGCGAALEKVLSDFVRIAPIILLVVGLIEVFALVSSLSLCCAIRSSAV